MNELQILPPKPKGFKRMSVIFGNGKNTNSRNSRDIHKYMNVKTKYHMWIKRRVDSLGAEENIDFIVLKNGHDKFTEIDYIITDDFAKHLGMLEKTSKGKEVRNYFIYMEKLARYLIEKKMQECLITIEKKETKLLVQIKQLKERSYSKPRTGDFQLVDRIRQDYNIQATTHELNELLEKENIIINEPFMVSNFEPNEDCDYSIKQGRSTLVYTPTVLDVVDSFGIVRLLGHEDINKRLF